MKKIAVIICAAGASARFGGNKKKPFVEVGGRTAFQRSMEFFVNRDDVKQVILVISPDDEEFVRLKWGPNLSFYGVKLCLGGAERFDTVGNALKVIDEDIEIIAVHDAVRCCLQDKWIDDVFAKATETGAAMLATQVVATLKKVKDGEIVETVDRANLYEAQTPQVFEAQLLKKAYANIENVDKSKISDDSALVEAMGKTVSIVETDSSNLKITRKGDVPLAAAIIKARPKPKPDGPVGPYIEAQW